MIRGIEGYVFFCFEKKKVQQTVKHKQSVHKTGRKLGLFEGGIACPFA